VRTRVKWAAAAIVALLGAPLLVGSDYDSYPLSTYPMFAHDRDDEVAVRTAIAVDGAAVARLSPRLIGGTDEPMLARESVEHAIDTGAAMTLCEEIAGRARRAGVSGEIHVVTERYDTLAWFDGDREPLDRAVHASCEVAS